MRYGYKERSFVDTLLIYSPLMPKVILAKMSQEAGLFNEDIKKYSKWVNPNWDKNIEEKIVFLENVHKKCITVFCLCKYQQCKMIIHSSL